MAVVQEGGRRSSREGWIHTMKGLLEEQSDIHSVGEDGNTPLIRATLKGNVELVRLLLDKEVMVDMQDDYTGATALIWAVKKDFQEIVELLLSHGASVEVRDRGGRTALDWANHREEEDEEGMREEVKVEALREEKKEVSFKVENNCIPKTAYSHSDHTSHYNHHYLFEEKIKTEDSEELHTEDCDIESGRPLLPSIPPSRRPSPPLLLYTTHSSRTIYSLVLAMVCGLAILASLSYLYFYKKKNDSHMIVLIAAVIVVIVAFYICCVKCIAETMKLNSKRV